MLFGAFSRISLHIAIIAKEPLFMRCFSFYRVATLMGFESVDSTRMPSNTSSAAVYRPLNCGK